MKSARSKTIELALAVSVTVAILSSCFDHPLTAGFKIGFVLVAPGLALMRLSRLPLSLLELCSLALVTSAALTALIATLAVYVELWSPDVIFCLILAATAALALLQRCPAGARSEEKAGL